MHGFLPISQYDLKKRGWSELDIILVSGDAYVDHPSFGAALIGRFLESKGFKVGIISQPDWRHAKDFQLLGKPRLFFGVTSGNLDSMVANYTANKRPRVTDDYSPQGLAGKRPDRALIVYANRLREVFGETPIILGGIEASLRRLAHYDYWDNKVRRSVLLDSKADILVYGMGERQILEIAQRLSAGEKIEALNDIRGTVINRRDYSFVKNGIQLPSFEEAGNNPEAFNLAFKVIYDEQAPATGKPLIQRHADRRIIQLPPALPLSVSELDKIYELPYCRNWHPVYGKQKGVPAFETVRFSITSHRGCCGECSFCSLSLHQGRIVVSRSPASILKEAKMISRLPYFRGTITDVAGPTANLYQAHCSLWDKNIFCKKHCLTPAKCGNLKLGYEKGLELYKKIKEIPSVKHVFIASGFRFDLLADDVYESYLKQIMKGHISGYMKVAPEHISAHVLEVMNKAPLPVYEKFLAKFNKINSSLQKKCFLVSYFITAHPAATVEDAKKLGLYVRKHHLSCEQIQDFIPLPMTLSACIYYTGSHPFSGKAIYSAKTFRERKAQRAFTQKNFGFRRKNDREKMRLQTHRKGIY